MYRQARNRCLKEVKRTKKQYYKKLYTEIEEEADSKKLYKLTGELLDIRTGNMPQSFLIKGKMVRKPQEMANCQLNFYNEKLQKLRDSMPDSNRDPLNISTKLWRPGRSGTDVQFLVSRRLIKVTS